MRLTTILILLLTTTAQAGPQNPGPLNSTEIFSNQAVTTAGVTSDFDHSYEVGKDSVIVINLDIQGAQEGATVTVTPLWEMADGNIPFGTTDGYPQEEVSTPQAYTWTQGQRPQFFHRINPLNGTHRMYLAASTTDSDGVTLTAKVNGTPR